MVADELTRVMRSTLCPELSPEQAAQIVKVGKPLTVAAGQFVFREGDQAAGLFVFLKGKAEVMRGRSDGRGIPIATAEAPTVLGEMSLITERPYYSATVRAETECELFLVPRAEFLRLLWEESVAAYKVVVAIAEVLARRMYRMDEKLLTFTQQGATAPVEELAAFKEKLFSEWLF
jgi:CRP-like cAMP-binding protein